MCVRVWVHASTPPGLHQRIQKDFILHLAFSSIITAELWSHHELHTYSLLHAHVYAHIRQINMYSFTHDDTPTRSNPHAQNPAHIPPSRGITVQSQPLFLRGKTCFIISFHFFRLRYLSPSPLPPSATCSPPQTPLLKSQATSRAPTAALSCWPCDDLSVHSVCLWTDMDMQMKGSSTFEFLRECQCNINVTKKSGL